METYTLLGSNKFKIQLSSLILDRITSKECKYKNPHCNFYPTSQWSMNIIVFYFSMATRKIVWLMRTCWASHIFIYCCLYNTFLQWLFVSRITMQGRSLGSTPLLPTWWNDNDMFKSSGLQTINTNECMESEILIRYISLY